MSVASDEIGARLKFEFECILGLVHARARIPPNARSFCCLELLLCISFLRLLQCSISCGCNWGSWRSTQVRVYFLPPNLVRRSFCCSVWSSFFASPFVSSSMQLVSPSARQVKMQFRHFCSLCGAASQFCLCPEHQTPGIFGFSPLQTVQPWHHTPIGVGEDVSSLLLSG